MNKVNSTGLNLINRITEDKNSEKIISKNQIIEQQKNVLKQSNLIDENNFLQNVSDAINNVAKTQNEAAEITKYYEQSFTPSKLLEVLILGNATSSTFVPPLDN